MKMLENIYTTKMSASKRTLQTRFAKIRSGSGKLSKMMALISGAVVVAVMVCATVVMASFNAQNAGSITVLWDGAQKGLSHKPFVSNSEVYIPLRETLNICGVNDQDITYDNGKITVTFYPEKLGGNPIRAYITAGQSNISFDLDSKYRIMGITDARTAAQPECVRTTTHPALVLNDTTYIPLGMALRLKNYYYAKNFDDRIYLDLLGSLEIREYDENGKYNAVLCAPIDMNKADKYNPSSYCEKDEKVIIGTAEDFESENFGHTEVNNYYYPVDAKKHILVDDDGKVIAVMPYENFKHESVNPTGGGTSMWTGVTRRANDPFNAERGGFNIFSNEKRIIDGKEYGYCLDYCFIDFRYLAD